MLFLIDASRANNDKKTGVEWYAFFVIQELKKIIPPEARVILYTREPLKGQLAQLPSHWSEKVLRWPPRRLWTQIRLSWEIFKMKKQFGDANLALFVPAHVLPLVTPAKIFLTIHDLGGVRFPQGYSLFERWYARWTTCFALKRAVVFSPLEFSKNEVIYHFKDCLNLGWAEKIKVIPNGYDEGAYFLGKDAAKIKSVLDKYSLSQPYFLSLGRLEEKKNTAGLVLAFNLFKSRLKANGGGGKGNGKEFSLVLLGKPGYGFERVRETIAKSEFKKDIFLPGWAAQADVPYLMAGATAFIFPSFYEGFGIPVLEAMASGVPVICSGVSSLPEVAGGAALLVNPYKPEEIAEAMRIIISEISLRGALIAKGLERVKNFDWQKTARGVWEEVRGLSPISLQKRI